MVYTSAPEHNSETATWPRLVSTSYEIGWDSNAKQYVKGALQNDVCATEGKTANLAGATDP